MSRSPFWEAARRWMPSRTRTTARSSSRLLFRQNGTAAAPICKPTRMCSGGCGGGWASPEAHRPRVRGDVGAMQAPLLNRLGACDIEGVTACVVLLQNYVVDGVCYRLPPHVPGVLRGVPTRLLPAFPQHHHYREQ